MILGDISENFLSAYISQNHFKSKKSAIKNQSNHQNQFNPGQDKSKNHFSGLSLPDGN